MLLRDYVENKSKEEVLVGTLEHYASTDDQERTKQSGSGQCLRAQMG